MVYEAGIILHIMSMKNNKGVITLELLIALVLLLATVIAVVHLVIYCQNMAVDTITNHEALQLARNNLEEIKGLSAENFNAINNSSNVVSNIYNLENSVQDFQCEKLVTSLVKWEQNSLRPKQVSASTILENVEELNSLGLDCNKDLTNIKWNNFILDSGFNFLPVTASATSIDIIDNLAFISVIDTIAANPDLYILSLNDIENIAVLYSLNTGIGINSIDAVKILNKYYAYIAQNSTTYQFQVVEFNSNLLYPPVLMAGISLPGVTPTGSYPQGRTIFYYNGLVYIGVHRTAGKELQIYSVQNNPVSPIWKGSLEINHNVNDLYIRKQKIEGLDKILVFMATSGNADDLMVIDATDATNLIKFTSAYLDLPGNEDGKSLYISGNKLFLGRYKSTTQSHNDFYVLDISHPEVGVTIEASANLGMSDITNIIASGNRIAVSAGGGSIGFKVLNYENSQLSEVGSYSQIQGISGLDFLGSNLLFVSKYGQNLAVYKSSN